jgi:hypothetical protein
LPIRSDDDDVGAEFIGVRSGVERRRGGRVGIETVAWWAESDDRNAGKKRKSSRSGVHHADAVVRGPV